MIQLIKIDIKDCIHKIILKKCIMVSTNILRNTTVFNIENNKKCFLSGKSEYFRLIFE